MKTIKSTTRLFAVIMAALMTLLSICSALPAAALSEKDAAYNAEDVALLRDFLETEDAEGVKIGEKLNPGVYDPDDPETWSFVVEYTNDFDGSLYSITHGISWEEIDGELRATGINLDYYQTDICGHLAIPGCAYLHKVSCYSNSLTSIDLSACPGLTELDVGYNKLTDLDITCCPNLTDLVYFNNEIRSLDISCCPNLQYLICSDNGIENLDLSGCPELIGVYCDSNKLTKLDVSCCPNLTVLGCFCNDLRELDLSGHAELVELRASENLLANVDLSGCAKLRSLELYPNRNRLVDLDLSDCPLLYFDHIIAEGNGHIGCGYFWDDGYSAEAAANPGAEFLGWFTEDGECISTYSSLYQVQTEYTTVIARFTGTLPVPGDCSGDGIADASDALIVLRVALGLVDETPEMLQSCDMDGNGAIDAADALIILRIALGIE